MLMSKLRWRCTQLALFSTVKFGALPVSGWGCNAVYNFTGQTVGDNFTGQTVSGTFTNERHKLYNLCVM